MTIRYQTGFGNYFESEALANALPQGQNSPQKVPFGLYAEQLNGTAFTSPRATNLRSWLYRILPSVKKKPFTPYTHFSIHSENTLIAECSPNPMRWDPIPHAKSEIDFIDSWLRFAGHGSPQTLQGGMIYLYACNTSMKNRYFYNADGDLLIIPQEGRLLIKTEFGILNIGPGEIALIYRGIQFTVELLEKNAKGYISENFGAHYTLPERGLIGANGLTNNRDFQAPTACFEDKNGVFQLICKFQNTLWQSELDYSPLNVVAWHGNYVPYQYDLRKFNTMNTVSYDHADPSIFTVLTSPSAILGTANLDFVIFPSRWMVAEHTFRLPYYHRNSMNEFMGLIYGKYDAKGVNFCPGSSSIHNCMVPHGPDANAYEKGRDEELKPCYYDDTLAFMLESQFPWMPSQLALNSKLLQKNYWDCWQGLKKEFQV